MRDALKSYLSLAAGLTEVTRQRAVAAAKALVSQGEATAEQVTTLAEDLVSQSRANREAVSALVKFEVDRALGRVGLASSDEVGDLAARVRALETELRGLRSTLTGTGTGTAGSTAARSGPVQQPPAKTESAGLPPTPDKGAKKAAEAGQREPAADRAASTAAKKVPAKKVPAKKAPAKRAPAKKAPAARTPATARKAGDDVPGGAAPDPAAAAGPAPATTPGGTGSA